MKISKTLLEYLYQSHCTVVSNILLTDLSTIKVIVQDKKIEQNANIPITEGLQKIIKNFKSSNNTSYIKTNIDSISLFETDSNDYLGQMILPISHNNELSGLLVFYRYDNNFINSSLKYGKTIKHFVEIFSSDDFVDKE